MIAYLETALGLESGVLSSPFGIMLCLVCFSALLYLIIKVLVEWLRAFF